MPHWLFKDIITLKIYVAPGNRIKDAKTIVERTGVGIMANAFLMSKSSSHRAKLKKLKEDTGTYFGLDNGAYQAWTLHKPLVPADLILHYAKLLKCDLVITQDVIGNPEETRRHHKIWSKWIKTYPLVAVLQGGTVSKKALEEDITLYKNWGYTRFAFPAVAALRLNKMNLALTARKLTPYLHGLGMARLKKKYLAAFDSIDFGLWQARESPYEPYSLEKAISFVRKIQTF